jgi:hypothetical protein
VRLRSAPRDRAALPGAPGAGAPSGLASAPCAPPNARRRLRLAPSIAARSRLRAGGAASDHQIQRFASPGRQALGRQLHSPGLIAAVTGQMRGRRLPRGDHEHPRGATGAGSPPRRSPTRRNCIPGPANAWARALKSAPPFEESSPLTFSITSTRGARPSAPSASNQPPESRRRLRSVLPRARPARRPG